MAKASGSTLKKERAEERNAQLVHFNQEARSTTASQRPLILKIILFLTSSHGKGDDDDGAENRAHESDSESKYKIKDVQMEKDRKLPPRKIVIMWETKKEAACEYLLLMAFPIRAKWDKKREYVFFETLRLCDKGKSLNKHSH